MLRFLRGVTARRASAPYLHFVQQVVIPHSSLFGYLIMTGEMFAAVSLLTGTLTRVGSTIAMFLFLNYMLAEGRIFWSPDSEDAALIFITILLFLGRAGRAFGIDSYLAKRWPKSPLGEDKDRLSLQNSVEYRPWCRERFFVAPEFWLRRCPA